MRRNEDGAALVIGLLLLVVVTLIGVSTYNSSLMQERIAGAQVQMSESRMAAETALTKAAQWLIDDANAGFWSALKEAFKEKNPDDIKTTVMSANSAINSELGGDVEIALIALSTNRVEMRARPAEVDNQRGLGRVITAVFSAGSTGEDTPFAGLGADAPAAISCFGAYCKLVAGQGQAQVDGTDFGLPPLNCSGRGGPNGCLNATPTGEVRPAVFFQDTTSDALGAPGATSNCKYKSGPHCHPGKTSGKGKGGVNTPSIDGTVVKAPAHYPVEDIPQGGEFFDPSSAFSEVTSGESTFNSSRDNPKLHYIGSNTSVAGGGNFAGLIIIDGAHLQMQGNTLFEGLILIRNCGSLGMGGTPFVYGAIVVNSMDCGPDYDPFGGNGTPEVRFSLEALGLIDDIPGGGGDGDGVGRIVSWQEFVPH